MVSCVPCGTISSQSGGPLGSQKCATGHQHRDHQQRCATITTPWPGQALARRPIWACMRYVPSPHAHATLPCPMTPPCWQLRSRSQWSTARLAAGPPSCSKEVTLPLSQSPVGRLLHVLLRPAAPLPALTEARPVDPARDLSASCRLSPSLPPHNANVLPSASCPACTAAGLRPAHAAHAHHGGIRRPRAGLAPQLPGRWPGPAGRQSKICSQFCVPSAHARPWLPLHIPAHVAACGLPHMWP